MAKTLEIYKCELCGNIVEVLHGGGGELVCCGEAMKLFVENTVDASKEKHVPVIERNGGTITVKWGAHPIPWKRSITSSGLKSSRAANPAGSSSNPEKRLKRRSRRQRRTLPPGSTAAFTGSGRPKAEKRCP